MNPDLQAFLENYNPEVCELILQLRHLVQEILPDLLEIVDPPSKIIAYGYGSNYKDLICAIAPYRSYVNLIFSRGAMLPDPQDLLTGAGKKARHVRITQPGDLTQAGLRLPLETALVTHPQG